MTGEATEKTAMLDLAALAAAVKRWGAELGFHRIGIADCDLSSAEPRLLEWLERGWHGDMDYMARHGVKRSRPAELVPGTVRVVCARMNYLPNAAKSERVLEKPDAAFISRYALGRDYHKVLRAR